MWKYVYNLKPEECICISHDHNLKKDFNDEMYEFLTLINNIEIYIKITINEYGVLCLCFIKVINKEDNYGKNVLF